MDSLRNFGFLLKDVSRLYSRNFERHAAALNLTLEQCRILMRLARHEGVSQSRLAWLTDTDPMTIGRIVDRMEGDGLLERRPDPADRRVRLLFLTATARPVLQRIQQVADHSRAESLSGLGADEQHQLLALLERLYANLEARVPGRGSGACS